MSNVISQTAASVSPARENKGSTGSKVSTRLGEELPIFCEKCGYSLFGLGQLRCDRCEILHFHCPECGHRQPINTLRPAAQRVIGRIRALWLVWSVFFRLNFIGWSLFGWFIAGWEYHRSFGYNPDNALDGDGLFAVAFWGFLFGAICRMMLLRWSRHWAVGLVIGALVFTAAMLGAAYGEPYRYYPPGLQIPEGLYLITGVFFIVGAAATAVGGGVAWYAWAGLVHAFLPRSTATTLLNWQRSLSNSKPAPSSSSE